MGYYLIIGIFTLASMYVSHKLKSKFQLYSRMRLSNGMSGKEIAEQMLADNGINDVRVVSVPGQLTDHYDPRNKTVNLSEGVYLERSAAAAAVAAHECGHAVQHKVGYKWLNFRSKMVPAVNVSSNLSMFLIMGGIALYATMNIPYILILGIVFFAVTTIFTFVTLPVEYDASNRALAWMEQRNIVQPREYAAAKDSLKWAARTYLVAAIGSLAQLLYFLSMLDRRN
ncbi:zinc metallopeptidase [Ornithobacterium rhinotracheale]|uniref:Putative Zn-dependent protease n=1 Tax=Ornithobacterium rhinotracheale (strain ATCC 51463 / DSM 15997 / CCUG 23171 / CIP 104009 / LMG 9086) TaxID=867902 RepID=I4A2Z5_ORNRL|nr:zinc metallopeptidase [Ornithobacterium rhinotracheale]AFL98329.1 putative Zn-dependent protease [Ornithobacterium rhinotracheale DSM 15997]AIQ00099.1 membrane protein [Ornithobacterium rhinotracheale ORT-UMN 88]KGB65712.1 membrane protein [Ornithobacterium rhinotracheale H06-030791]MBN3662780.1 zinc metallopeptidase [Ornithobacterium rhinotracheale]MCK0193324.1 zinc metallopeptidase [Ornithobacterium rhinotracheale]